MRSLHLFSLFMLSFSTQAQQLQSPEEFLGYELGTRFTRHHQVVEYFRSVADVLPNVKLEHYGETYEHRPLVYAIVASRENFKKIDEIRLNNLKRTGLESGETEDNDIAIVWLSYNVHGNESVSMEASMKTLYELADPGNEKTQKWLKNTIVILDPCINPDGRDRYANFYNQYGNRIPNPDPNSKEHAEPWPGGRGNHYLYDLNRDWAWLKQQESQARLKVYQEWMPHVHVDFHEQSPNSPYYFAPAAEPYHELITPWQRDFQVMIGKNNAKYFDENGWLYFTKERFDLLYPSYGDTYPTYNGAIGMTYEQGGGGRAGLTYTTAIGDELTLTERIAHHHSNGLSTVEITAANAGRVIDEFEDYFRSAPGRAEYKTYLVKAGNDPDKMKSLLEYLDAHQIRYGHPATGRKALNGFHYPSTRNRSVSISSDDIVINVDQPKSTLVTVLFEPKTFLKDSITYDITAWSMPYARGLDVYALRESISTQRLVDNPGSNYEEPPKNAYAYIVSWKSFEDARFLAHIQREGVKVRSSAYPFSVEGQAFSRGSLVITRRNNESLGDDLHRIIVEAGRKFDRKIYTTRTGMVDTGYDLGSGNVNYIKAPKVALLSGNGTRSTSFGEAWYYFEQEIEYPLAVLDTDYLSRVDLSEYDVIVMPNGRYRLNENQMSALGDWVSSGGRLIAMDGALNTFVNKEGFGLKRYLGDKKEEDEVQNADELVQRYEDREREQMKEIIPGAIYRVRLDDSHPLAFGYDKDYFSLKISEGRYAYLERGWNVGVLGKGATPVNGFAGYKANSELSESLVFGVFDKGSGEIVYFVDNPLFRSFWENGKLIFSNAVFMVGQ